MEKNNDMIVLFQEMHEIPHVITNIVWNKDQFAGKMLNYIIYGIVYNENISATYILPESKANLNGVILEYGNYSNYN